MAYRADIEIAVRGAQDLKRLQNEISATSKLITSLNSYIENIGTGGVVRNIQNLQDTVQKAANAFNAAALNTEEATIAARKYIAATDDLNTGLRERQALLKSINEEERKGRLSAIGREVGGRASSGYAGPIGPGAASPIGALVGQQSPVAERIQRTIKGREDETNLQQALLRLEQKSAEELNKKVQSQEALVQGTREVLNLIDQQNKRQKFLAGTSGTAVQGPLAGPKAMGFPVALPLSAAEQRGLELATKKQEILQRTAVTQQQLVGLAANLQRIEQNAAVSIADAQRETAATKATLELRYNWARVLAKGAEISEDLARLSAKDAENAQLTLRAKRTEAKIQEAIARNRQKANEIDERTARKKQSRTDISSAVIGGAFPLLFGQGIGASFGGAVGGGLGARFGGQGGFAGSLVGTFAGQATIDFAINSAVQLGTALRKPTENIKELTKFLGIAGTQLDANISVLQNLGMESSASAVALAKLEDILKAEGYKNIDTLSKQLTDLENAFSRLKLAAANLLSEPLTDFLNWLTDTIKLMSRAGGVGGFITTSPEQLQAIDRQIQSERRASSQAAETPGVAELAAQKLISQEEKRQLDLAGAQVQLERQRMSLTRVELASKQGSIELLRIANDLEKKNVELNNAKEKSKRMQLELDVKLLKQQQAQAEAARQNAIIEAQRQVDRELLGLYNQQFTSQIELNNLYAENKGLSEGQLAGLVEQNKNLDEEKSKKLSILYNQREAALIGVNELNVRKEIISSYDYLAQQVKDEITNRKVLNGQQQAEYNLTRLQIEQQRELNKLQAENQARQQLKSLTTGLDPKFMGLFGGSRRTETLMRAEFETRSNELRDQLAGLEQQKAIPNIAPDTLQRLKDQEKELTNVLAVYTEYQPAIIQATVAQERFNEALALTSPIVDSIFTGITNVVTGTQTAQEAFAAFLNTVGQMLLDTVKQMIAQYIALGVAKMFAFGPSGNGFSFSGAGPVSGASVFGAGQAGFNPAAFTGGFTLMAEGGFVTKPTRAVVGEGGEPEYVIPASKMRSAMGRYASGARGSNVLSADGSTGEMGGAATMAPAAIDVRYSVERINNVDYVTADQFQAGMAQAAQQGAIQGERRAMRTLTNSAAARGRLRI